MSASIPNLLQQQFDSTSSLTAVINDEYQALIKRDSDLLNSLVLEKQKLLELIEQQDNLIQQHPDAKLLTQKSDVEINTILDSIKQKFLDCQQQNAVNGELIEMSLRTTQHLTNVLNQAKAANSLTYNAKGKANGGSLLGKGVQA